VDRPADSLEVSFYTLKRVKHNATQDCSEIERFFFPGKRIHHATNANFNPQLQVRVLHSHMLYTKDHGIGNAGF